MCVRVRFVCTPPNLAGVCDVCVWVPVSAFTPTILAGVLASVCLWSLSAANPPVLAGPLGVRVCAWVRILAPPRHSWLGCWGVCVRMRTPPVPRDTWLGFVVCPLKVAWHPLPCRGSLHVVRDSRVCGSRWPLLLGTCLCALVTPHGALRLGWSSGSRCFSPLSRCLGAFPLPGGLHPRIYWAAARGTWRPAGN